MRELAIENGITIIKDGKINKGWVGRTLAKVSRTKSVYKQIFYKLCLIPTSRTPKSHKVEASSRLSTGKKRTAPARGRVLECLYPRMHALLVRQGSYALRRSSAFARSKYI